MFFQSFEYQSISSKTQSQVVLLKNSNALSATYLGSEAFSESKTNAFEV